jgi:hypothetical protein
MNKYKVIICLLAPLFFVTCSLDKESDIVGTWKFTDIQSSEQVPEDQKQQYQETIEEYKATYSLVFKNDSTFEKSISESVSTGKWQISDDNKTLTLTYDDGVVENSQILELSKAKLVTTFDNKISKYTISFEKQIDTQIP